MIRGCESKISDIRRCGAEARVSAKALRLYEESGLINPGRSAAGWRIYDPAAIDRAMEIIAYRALGMSLSTIADLLARDAAHRNRVMARHKSDLETKRRALDETLGTMDRSCSAKASKTMVEATTPLVELALPWPWDGERLALRKLPPLSFITGPLGSGKTRLATRLAKVIPGGRFLDLDRSGSAERPISDGALGAPLERLRMIGATITPSLEALVKAICSDPAAPLVIDMVEQHLDHSTQEALIAWLRERSAPARPLVLMTRSSAILDLAKMHSGEMTIYCPANHSLPLIVNTDPTCPGREAVETCLASPVVRARTEGVIAVRGPQTVGPINDSRETFC